MSKNLPFCSVIVLNYFGEKVISQTLDSLIHLDYPKDGYEIIVVDNNSKDLSREILTNMAKLHDNLKLVFLKENLGFSKGNNIGIKKARGEYVALINNDCVADTGWLKGLVGTALKQSRVFAVNSKILLYPKYLKVDLKIKPELSPVYSWISKSGLYQFNSKRLYLNLSGKDGLFKTEIPFDVINDGSIEVELVCNLKKDVSPQNLKKLIGFSIPGVEILEFIKKKSEVVYKISIVMDPKMSAFNRIQNAGIMPFQDGYARDIGGIVRDYFQYYERDNGQYDQELEIYAACGAAILMNKQVLEKIGYLDESFFMYYEDVEISERARLKGYKIYYSPKAVVRHIHALSAKEGSGFFVFNVEKGRLLHVFYNFPLRIFLKEYFKVLLIIIYGLIKAVFRFRSLQIFNNKTATVKPLYRRKLQKIYVLLFFLTHLPQLIYLRSQKNKSNGKGSVSRNYREILNGRWYFN